MASPGGTNRRGNLDSLDRRDSSAFHLSRARSLEFIPLSVMPRVHPREML